MATFQNFEEIIAWQKARVLCKKIKLLTEKPLFAKDFKLRDQILSSSGSIMDNIAEGFERQGNKEFVQFLYISSQKAHAEKLALKHIEHWTMAIFLRKSAPKYSLVLLRLAGFCTV